MAVSTDNALSSVSAAVPSIGRSARSETMRVSASKLSLRGRPRWRGDSEAPRGDSEEPDAERLEAWVRAERLMGMVCEASDAKVEQRCRPPTGGAASAVWTQRGVTRKLASTVVLSCKPTSPESTM